MDTSLILHTTTSWQDFLHKIKEITNGEGEVLEKIVVIMWSIRMTRSKLIFKNKRTMAMEAMNR